MTPDCELKEGSIISSGFRIPSILFQFSKHHMIFLAMQNASDQKTEMEKIKGKMAQELSKIEERKSKIDDELKEVQVSCKADFCIKYDIICE